MHLEIQLKQGNSLAKLQKFFGESVPVSGLEVSALSSASSTIPLIPPQHQDNCSWDDEIVPRKRLSDSTLIGRRSLSDSNSSFVQEQEHVAIIPASAKDKVIKFFGKEQVPMLIGEGSSAKTSRVLGVQSFKVVDILDEREL